jgi:phosphoglycerol transferase
MLQNGPALVAAAGAFYRLVCFSGAARRGATVQRVDKAQWKGKTAFKDTVIDTARYQRNVDMLKIVDNDIRYKADSFIFNVAGAPEEVKQFSGISRPESWGRWSNAQLGDEVKIEYTHPLPEKFDLVITAKAFGPNANQPIPVRVGNQEQTLTLGNNVTTTTLHFDNPSRSKTLVIVPPDPQSTNEGNIRRLTATLGSEWLKLKS